MTAFHFRLICWPLTLLALAPAVVAQGISLNTAINGVAGQLLGRSLDVSDDGTVLAISSAAPPELHIYRKLGGSWTGEGTITLPNANGNRTVDVDADGTQVIASDQVVVWTGTSWVVEQDLGTGGLPSAIQGDVLTIGVGSTIEPFFRTAPGAWAPEGTITLPSIVEDLCLAGDTVYAGSSNGSVVYTFTRSGSFPFATWSQGQTISGQTGSNFGWSIDCDGERLLVGVRLSSQFGPQFGEARLFSKDSQGTWVLANTIRPLATPISNYRFGSGVSLDWPFAAVSPDPFVDPGLTRVHSFVLAEQNTSFHHCELDPTLPAPGGTPSSAHGLSVALRGSTLAVADFSWDSSGNSNEGRVSIYDVDIAAAQGASLGSYCTGKTNSLGCIPFITASGIPSPTDPAVDFIVRGHDVIPNNPGILFYGVSGQLDLSFHGGKLCVKAPLVRLFPPAVPKKGGQGACSPYVITRGMGPRIRSGVDPTLTTGQTVRAQWLLRDPNDPAGFADSLTNAVRFVICD